MKTVNLRFSKISIFIPLMMSFILFNSCKKDKDDDVIQLPIKIFKLDPSNESHYSYDTQNRLIEIASYFSLQHIEYEGSRVSKWIIEENQNSEISEHFYYYSNNLIDSIRYTNPSYYEIELEHYIHNGNKYLKKLRYSHGILSTTSIFQYETDRIISETFIMHEAWNTEIIYTYKYDDLGNIIQFYNNGDLIEEYEYTDKLNPLYLVSTYYLEKTPIGFYEFNPRYSKYLVTREKTLSGIDGTLLDETIYHYTFNENQQPTYASIEYNHYYFNQFGTSSYEYEY
jgi:hypothetical protein